MENIFAYICADENKATASWIVNSFPIIKIVIMSILALLAIALIVLIVMQKGNTNGSSALTGKSDTFYNRNKKSTLQGNVLAKLLDGKKHLTNIFPKQKASVKKYISECFDDVTEVDKYFVEILTMSIV